LAFCRGTSHIRKPAVDADVDSNADVDSRVDVPLVFFETMSVPINSSTSF
jgi:hypothetical protein